MFVTRDESLRADAIVDCVTQGLGFLAVTEPFQRMYGLVLAREVPPMDYFATWYALIQVRFLNCFKIDSFSNYWLYW